MLRPYSNRELCINAMGRLFFLLIAACLPAIPVQAEQTIDSLDGEGGQLVAIVEVVDGDTVVLSDGRQVRLVGIQAPKLPLGRKGFEKWPLADESKAALEKVALNQKFQLRYGGSRMDRHGRVLAHMVGEDGLWAQGEMLRLGMARVYTFPDNRAVIPALLEAEREARKARRGIWAHAFYGVRQPDKLGELIGTFQLIEGTVLNAAKVKGTYYLNFGTDWRKDFTVRVKSTAARLFKKSGLDPLGLKGKVVRVRGWLKSYNGPMIEATHPEQIEEFQ